MTTNPLLARDTIVDTLRHAVKDGRFGLSDVPALLKRTIREDAWQERVIQQTGEVVKFDRFAEFITTPPLEGLGATVELLQRLCRDDKEALDLIDQATAGKHGGDRRSERIKDNNINLDAIESTKAEGTSATYALRKLRKDRPDLHERVLAGEVSPHGAMVEAGFRERTISIPVDAERAARAIKRHFSESEIEQLIDFLES